MGKVLYVEFINNWGTVCAAELKADEPNKRRVVQVPLTSEQAKSLEPRKLGMAGHQEIRESMRLLSIQYEEE